MAPKPPAHYQLRAPQMVNFLNSNGPPKRSSWALFRRRLQHWLCRLLNFLSFGWIRLPARAYLSDYYIAPNTTLNSGNNGSTSGSSLLTGSASGFNSSSGCLTGNSSDSDDAFGDETSGPEEGNNNTRRRRSQRRSVTVINNHSNTNNSLTVATDAVSHSYEDITRPDYHNYLWLSSGWDRTSLSVAPYFLPNWISTLIKQTVKISIEPKEDKEDNKERKSFFSFLSNGKRKPTRCRVFLQLYLNLSSLPDAFFPRRRITLPKRQKTLVLDLDETLIHSTAASCVGFDFMIEVLIGRTSCLYYVFKRPHLDYFLEVVGNWFNLVIFTASLKEYADPVIDLLDDGRKLFKKRLFRSSCMATGSSGAAYLKDLSLIDDDLSKLALIDNSAASFALYPDNAIPIESWRDDRGDQGLLELLPFLDALRFVDDVRSILSLRRLSLYVNK